MICIGMSNNVQKPINRLKSCSIQSIRDGINAVQVEFSDPNLCLIISRSIAS